MWVCVCWGVLVICVPVFTVFCIVYTVFLYCFVYAYLFLFALSLLESGLLPPSDNPTAVRSKIIIIIIIIITIVIYGHCQLLSLYSVDDE